MIVALIDGQRTGRTVTVDGYRPTWDEMGTDAYGPTTLTYKLKQYQRTSGMRDAGGPMRIRRESIWAYVLDGVSEKHAAQEAAWFVDSGHIRADIETVAPVV